MQFICYLCFQNKEVLYVKKFRVYIGEVRVMRVHSRYSRVERMEPLESVRGVPMVTYCWQVTYLP